MTTPLLIAEPASLLKRQPLLIDENDSDTDSCEPILAFETLGDQAAEQLGYEVLSDEIKKTKSKLATAKVPALLALLGIEPFDPQSVARYKTAMCKKAVEEQKLQHPFLTKVRSHFVLTVDILAVSHLCVIMAAVVVRIVGKETLSKVLFIGTVPSLMSLLIVAIIVMFAINRLKTFSWKLVPVNEYPGEIPTFALQTMLKIKSREPLAEFFVDELSGKPDPFGVLVIGEEKFWIDVWNEPGFDRKPLV